MRQDTGIIKVIQVDESEALAARIDCPGKLVPQAGKYLLAYNPAEPESTTSQALFTVGLSSGLGESEPALLGPVLKSWTPGTVLHLRGPLGQGFRLPLNIRRLALAAFSGSSARLLPLIPAALRAGVDVALFAPAHPLPGARLPAAVEIHPLSALAENLSWANFLAIDITPELLPALRQSLELEPHQGLPCQAQALVFTAMPCGGLAECGACAVPTKNTGYKLACKEGPVFDLNRLDW